jgi:hypothetical protein
MGTDLEEQQEGSLRSLMEEHFSSIFLVYYTICGFMNNTDCQGRRAVLFLVVPYVLFHLPNICDEDVCRFDPTLRM